MKITLIFALVSTVIFCLVQTPANNLAAEGSEKNPWVNSVFLLKGLNGICGSAVLLRNGHLLTNNHLAASVCPSADCSGLLLARAKAAGKPPAISFKPEHVRILRRGKALDFAELEVSWPDGWPVNETEGFFEPTAHDMLPPPGGELLLAGFPHCQTLELRNGSLVESSTLFFYTSAKGAHGSSGSALFAANGTLYGIVDQAASLYDALGTTLLKRGGKTRALKASVIAQALAESPASAIRYETRQLLQVYRNEVRVKEGLERLFSALTFLNAMEALRSGSALDREISDPAPLLLAGQYLNYLELDVLNRGTQPAADMETLYELVTAYNLELHGLNRAFMQPLTMPLATAAGDEKTSSKVKDLPGVKELLNYAAAHPFDGTGIYGAKVALLALTVITLLLCLWAFSLGFVFYASGGPLYVRLFKTLLVGVFFWPASLLVFVLRRRRMR